MALLTCHFLSDVLKVETAATVVLPQPPGARALDALPPVLYLLHGAGEDETTWTRRSSIERYALDLGVAVVMPRGGRSMYQDETQGSAYWTFLTDELPELVSRLLRVSTDRADTFVAGTSMGGYGAMRWALAQPDRFAAAASLSGFLDIVDPDHTWAFAEQMPHVFGGRPTPGSDADLLTLLDRADHAALPALYVTCGTEDFLAPNNRRFLARTEERGIPVRTVWRPGDHEWGFWDAAIQEVLTWLPIRRP